MNECGEKLMFPLVRKISAPVTSVLAKTPISANQVSLLSLGFGLLALWYFHHGDYFSVVTGACFFVVSYVLDNCDGEIARLKNQTSVFGMHFDTFVDWLVNAGFFAALGIGYAEISGNEIWIWIGWTGAAGGTINYLLGIAFIFLDKREAGPEPSGAPDPARPNGLFQWFIFMFRELARADFCFLVLALAAFDVLWILLPAGAIGAQVYWILLCVKSARQLHA